MNFTCCLFRSTILHNISTLPFCSIIVVSHASLEPLSRRKCCCSLLRVQESGQDLRRARRERGRGRLTRRTHVQARQPLQGAGGRRGGKRRLHGNVMLLYHRLIGPVCGACLLWCPKIATLSLRGDGLGRVPRVERTLGRPATRGVFVV